MLTSNTKDITLVALLVFIISASGLDLSADLSHGADYRHIVKEGAIIFLSTIGILFLLFSLYQQGQKIDDLQQELKATNHAKKHPPKYILDTRTALSTVIKQQFIDWKLTNSEVEVAWLLLKGLSLREISAIRNTKEKTTRQQASSIYKKSALNGRHALSAWFIEDVF